jgi:hypothetical protein
VWDFLATFQQDLGVPPPPLQQFAQALLSVDAPSGREASGPSADGAVGEEVLHWVALVLVKPLLADLAAALATPCDDHTLALVNRTVACF